MHNHRPLFPLFLFFPSFKIAFLVQFVWTTKNFLAFFPKEIKSCIFPAVPPPTQFLPFPDFHFPELMKPPCFFPPSFWMSLFHLSGRSPFYVRSCRPCFFFTFFARMNHWKSYFERSERSSFPSPLKFEISSQNRTLQFHFPFPCFPLPPPFRLAFGEF